MAKKFKFPAARPLAGITSDGQPVYRVLSWRGNATHYWLSLEPIQTVESAASDIDIRHAPGWVEPAYADVGVVGTRTWQEADAIWAALLTRHIAALNTEQLQAAALAGV